MGVLLGLLLTIAALAQEPEIRLVQLTPGIAAPTDIQHAGDGSSRLFLVQQNGIIRIHKDGALLARPFLDITSRTRADGERGLLGLAFPPDYQSKRRFYVDYTNLQGNTIIALYQTTSDPDVADPASERILLTINQPYANHNGGQLRFGPEGYLYIGMGDGGSGGDPENRAQNRQSLLGKILRIDVESEPGTVRIPPTNPFVNDASSRPEIWSLGLRNPWRFSFDRATADLWIGDVGQNAWEEVDFQPASSRGGENYGWRCMEGAHAFLPNTAGCAGATLVPPVAEYRNVNGQDCSVTGGFVYRGRMFPGLRGIYLYGDYCTGRIWGIERVGSEFRNRLLIDTAFSITTFGEDEAGELYVADQGGGRIYRIEGSRNPRFTSSGVVNAASFMPGLVAGSAATVFVAGILDSPGIVAADRIPLPTSLGGVSVTVNGIPAPLFAVANTNGVEQVNFQVPFEAAAQTASIVVSRVGSASPPVDIPVLDVQPGIFTSSGTAIVVHNADHSLVTGDRPLRRGEYAYFYAAGLGRVTNRPPTGDGGPVSPLAMTEAQVRVAVGPVPAEVQFAGLAPGLVGVYQVNFRVPDNIAIGAHDLILTAGPASSPPARVTVQ